MFESLRAGLRVAQHVDKDADVLLHLADHPEVASATLEAILAARAQFHNQALMPEYEGCGGHPVLIPAQLVADLISAPGNGGLRQYWLDHPQICRRLPVNDPGVIQDVDWPSSVPVCRD
jgi:molybdenum cofactor cytidylyltransferase